MAKSKQPIGDLGDTFNPSILLWGSPGSGKTTLAGSYSMGPVHFYETDPQGTTVLRDSPNEITADTFTDATCGAGKTYGTFWKQLQKDEKDGFFEEMRQREGIVVVDSYTTLENYLVEHVAGNRLGKKKQDGGAFDIRREDWPVISSYVLAFFKAISALPCATVVICHEKSIQDAENNIFWRPTILGQQADAAPRWFVEYGHCSLDKGGLKVRIKGNPSHPASSRLFVGAKARQLVNPTMDDFYKSFHGQKVDCKVE